MKNTDELRPVYIGDLIELGLIRVNPEADSAAGNARYIPTGNNDPAMARRLEGLYLAAQGARVTLPTDVAGQVSFQSSKPPHQTPPEARTPEAAPDPRAKEGQGNQHTLDALFEAYPSLPSAAEIVVRMRKALGQEDGSQSATPAGFLARLSSFVRGEVFRLNSWFSLRLR